MKHCLANYISLVLLYALSITVAYTIGTMVADKTGEAFDSVNQSMSVMG